MVPLYDEVHEWMPGKPKVFRRSGSRTRTELNKAYDQHRGSARERGYDSRWDREARSFRHANPLCLGCMAVGRVASATLVDHVIPHRGDQRLFWDRAGNWQSACETHGNAIKQQLEALYDQGKATKTDLRLNSPLAISITKRSMP